MWRVLRNTWEEYTWWSVGQLHELMPSGLPEKSPTKILLFLFLDIPYYLLELLLSPSYPTLAQFLLPLRKSIFRWETASIRHCNSSDLQWYWRQSEDKVSDPRVFFVLKEWFIFRGRQFAFTSLQSWTGPVNKIMHLRSSPTDSYKVH